MNSIFTCLASCFSCCSSQPIEEWTDTILGDQVVCYRVTEQNEVYVKAICQMYDIDRKSFVEKLKTMVVWVICDQNNTPIGAIQLETYSSVSDLQKQVADNKLAQDLFSQGKVQEFSYALEEKNQGKGWGSKAVKAWIDHAISKGRHKKLFAVVDSDNKVSLRILEKNGLSCSLKCVHPQTGKEIQVFSFTH